MPETPELSHHAPRLYRVALRVLGDPHAAEEVVQEVFVRVLEKPDRFEGGAAWTTWLHRITVNCAIDRLRRNRSRKERHVEAELGGLAGALGYASGNPGPEKAAEERELLSIAKHLLNEMPDELRIPFVLTQLDGYSYDEAARTMQLPRGTVASRVSRAKLLLIKAGARVRRGWNDHSDSGRSSAEQFEDRPSPKGIKTGEP